MGWKRRGETPCSDCTWEMCWVSSDFASFSCGFCSPCLSIFVWSVGSFSCPPTGECWFHIHLTGVALHICRCGPSSSLSPPASVECLSRWSAAPRDSQEVISHQLCHAAPPGWPSWASTTFSSIKTMTPDQHGHTSRVHFIHFPENSYYWSCLVVIVTPWRFTGCYLPPSQVSKIGTHSR